MGTFDDMAEPRKEMSGVIRGEFFTDGKTFIFQLAGTPLSGSGDSPQSGASTTCCGPSAAAGVAGDRLRDSGAGPGRRADAGDGGRLVDGRPDRLRRRRRRHGRRALALVPMAVAGVAETTGKQLAKQGRGRIAAGRARRRSLKN